MDRAVAVEVGPTEKRASGACLGATPVPRSRRVGQDGNSTATNRGATPILDITMRGLITTRHLVINAPTIIHEFGLLAYLRCVRTVLLTRRHVTFLECIMRLRNH
jgi:hypothetical protein